MARKIYVASSWRNTFYPSVVQCFKAGGHEVYDFRNPPNGTGFSWSQIDPNWPLWGVRGYMKNMGFMQDGHVMGAGHPRIEEGFKSDMDALKWADTVVLVMPSGRSAHIEAGYAVGAGKQVFILLNEEGHEPDLMYKMAFMVTERLEDICSIINYRKPNGEFYS